MEKIIIYTDGSSKGNPGRGGWGAIIEVRSTSNEVRIKEIGGREEETTNNRMEMRAAIEALRHTPDDSQIEIHTDSEYLLKGITVWIKNWIKNNWRTKAKDDVLNKDLWEELLVETERRNIEWKRVVGHSGHKQNDRCDEIATSFADSVKVNLYDGPSSSYRFL